MQNGYGGQPVHPYKNPARVRRAINFETQVFLEPLFAALRLARSALGEVREQVEHIFERRDVVVVAALEHVRAEAADIDAGDPLVFELGLAVEVAGLRKFGAEAFVAVVLKLLHLLGDLAAVGVLAVELDFLAVAVAAREHQEPEDINRGAA